MSSLWGSELSAKTLTVDDEQSLVDDLRQILLLVLPCRTGDTAYSGKEALGRLAGTTCDLILAGLRLPTIDGLAPIRGLRSLDPRIRMSLTTGFGNPALQQEGQEPGVGHYLDKPPDVTGLLATVHSLLPEPGADRG